jgi:RNA polymerase sigma-70 factor (sigma-E family)
VEGVHEEPTHDDGQRDPEFEDLFGRLFPVAERLALRIAGDPATAEDLAAEAFVRLFARWPRLRKEPGREGWVLRVTANLAIDAARRRPPRVEAVAPVPPEDAVVLRVALAAALRALPRRQRAVVALRYLADLTEEQVAAALGISSGSVKTHAHRALRRLRQVLPNDPEPTVAN